MDSFEAFERGALARSAGNLLKVFDWEKAAHYCKSNPGTTISAGLEGDWEWTGGEIYDGTKPIPEDSTYTYLASVWATPQIQVDGELLPCWKWESDTPGWNAETYWPPKALEVLGS